MALFPLTEFSEAQQAQIREAVAAPKPPAKWIRFGHAQILSRAWYEWHMERGRDPRLARTLPPNLRQATIDRDGYVCQLCGGDVAPSDVHIDHILPVVLGGRDKLANLQVTHSTCNLRKGGRA